MIPIPSNRSLPDITTEMLRGPGIKDEKTVLEEFFSFIGVATLDGSYPVLVGHQALPFDIPFLQQGLARQVSIVGAHI
jgi:hypothetical protein